MFKILDECRLCPRECGVNRNAGQVGFCGVDSSIKIARAALHNWEEPCISGEKGSGAVFFSGCTLGCVFCQNYNISHGQFGREITVERLRDIFLELQQKGALNINLVTPTHYVPQIIAALTSAKKLGLSIPIVYNTSGFEKVETIKLLDGIVDVYLPDFKYMNSEYAKTYSSVSEYPKHAKAAIDEMVRQAGECVFDEDGIIQNGVIVRHLILPSHISDSKEIIAYLHNRYKDSIYISIMNQYTPFGELKAFPQLRRTITQEEYDSVVDYAISIGVENGFVQEGETAKESFIPPFDLEGVQ